MVKIQGMALYLAISTTNPTSNKNNLTEIIMGIGSGIVLFVAGAIVAFALNFNVSSVNMHLIGSLLMGAGVLIFLISLIAEFKKRSSSSVTRTAVDPSHNEKVVSQENKSDSL